MAKYRTLEEVELSNGRCGAGNVLELTDEEAAALEGKIELVTEEETPVEEAPEAPEESAPEAAPEGDEGDEEGAE